MRATDEGLLQSLHEGMFETPLWHGFLNRLRSRTGARYASLILRLVDRDTAVQIYAGPPPPEDIRALFVEGGLRDPLPYRTMRPDRVYALDDLLDRSEPEQRAYCTRILEPLGLSDMRAVRVVEPTGVDVCLFCTGGREIDASVGALFRALVPHLRIALRCHVALERERFRATVTSQVIDRLRIGWFTLDAQCRVIEATDNIRQLFQWGTLLRLGGHDRLQPTSPAIDRALVTLVRRFATGSEASPQAFVLAQDPWVDMLVSPAPASATAATVIASPRPAVAIAYVRGDRRSLADRCGQLAGLFGLLPSEARLAWMMAQVSSIPEAARAVGISVQTARSYSKRIYAKTGASGHPDLVRIILTSVLAIS